MEKIDLFQSIVRFLAIKPLAFEKFDLQQAKSIIKSDRTESITFVEDHHAFEEIIEQTAARVGELGIQNGTVYLYVKGAGCTERMKRNLLEIIMSVHKLIIFGDPKAWPLFDSKMQFVDPEGFFEENHQRFFVYQSAAYNVALVARHAQKDGNEVVEAAMTNAPDAVALASQMIGTRVYKNQQKDL